MWGGVVNNTSLVRLRFLRETQRETHGAYFEPVILRNQLLRDTKAFLSTRFDERAVLEKLISLNGCTDSYPAVNSFKKSRGGGRIHSNFYALYTMIRSYVPRNKTFLRPVDASKVVLGKRKRNAP